MMFEYYYIIIVVVFLKLCIWACVFYFRAQRLRLARTQRRFVVVDSRSTGVPVHVPSVTPTFPYNDRSAILDFEEVPHSSNQAFAQGPPSYAEAVHGAPTEEKPPTYEQVTGATPIPQDHRTPIPPHFTPPNPPQ